MKSQSWPRARKLGVGVLRPYREHFTLNCGLRQLAMKLASSEAAWPSELVIAISYLPGFSAGVTILACSYRLASPLQICRRCLRTPALKPLPRMVKVARRDEEPLTGAIVPIPGRTRPSWTNRTQSARKFAGHFCR